MKKLKLFGAMRCIAIIALAALIGFGILGCGDSGSGDPSSPPAEKPPEEKTAEERWGSWVDPESTATVGITVASDGVCAITIGGTALDVAWGGDARYQYSAVTGKRYTYKFEAWTDSGSRDVNVQYFNAGSYLDTIISIDDTRSTYSFTGDPIPTGGVRLLQFRSMNQLGTFYIKIISIEEAVELDFNGTWTYFGEPGWKLQINGNEWTKYEFGDPESKGTYTYDESQLSITKTHEWNGSAWEAVTPQTATGGYEVIDANTVVYDGAEFAAFGINGAWIKNGGIFQIRFTGLTSTQVNTDFKNYGVQIFLAKANTIKTMTDIITLSQNEFAGRNTAYNPVESEDASGSDWYEFYLWTPNIGIKYVGLTGNYDIVAIYYDGTNHDEITNFRNAVVYTNRQLNVDVRNSITAGNFDLDLSLDAGGGPIFISSAADLAKIGNDPGFPLDGEYVLVQNLSLPADWEPIGEPGQEFTGIFFGNDNTITMSGFAQSAGRTDYGLFGRINGANITSLTLNVPSDITLNFGSTPLSSHRFVGMLVGQAYNSVIEDIDVIGSSLKVVLVGTDLPLPDLGGGFPLVGGLAGRVYSQNNGIMRISDVTVSIDIESDYSYNNTRDANTSPNAVGGITGRIYNNSMPCVIIEKSGSTGNIKAIGRNASSTAHAGGIVGRIEAAEAIMTSLKASGDYASIAVIDSCYSTGNISAECDLNYAEAGGIAGRQHYLSRIANSAASGNINAAISTTGTTYAYAGGIVGFNQGYSAIFQCYQRTGKITAAGPYVVQAGGIAGRNAFGGSQSPITIPGSVLIPRILNCYSTGEVETSTPTADYGQVGGIAGHSPSGAVEYCAALNNKITGRHDVARVTVDAYNLEGNVARNDMVSGNGNWYMGGDDPSDVHGLGHPLSEFQKSASPNSVFQKTENSDGSGLGWDFSAAWKWSTGAYDYPILQWMPGNEY